MPIKVIAIILFLLIFAGLGYAAVDKLKASIPASNEEVKKQNYVEIGPLNVLVVQEDTASSSKRVLLCRETCTPAAKPSNALSDAYTDGKYWYYYASAGSDKITGEHIGLYKIPIEGGDAKSIIVQTPLVKPRDIFISPSGKKLIYFLDNIQDPKKNLTELWEYDTESEAVSVLTERVHQPDMMTRLKWNRAGDVVWFVANSGSEKSPKIELITVQTDLATTAAKFSDLNWQQLSSIADHGVMDINSAATALAYAQKNDGGNDTLVVVRGNRKEGAKVNGNVVFLQWLNGGELLYATQTTTGFSFWKLKDSKATQVAQQTGVLRSARSDSDGKYVALAADTTSSKTQLFTLDVSSGLLKTQASVPAFGQNIFVVQVNSLPTAASPLVAGATTSFPDDQIVPVIERNITAIAQEKTAKPTRLVFTDKANVVYVEYTANAHLKGRALVLIHNVINADWEVLARYEEAGTQWHKTQGSDVEDPLPKRIYEWEDTVHKWILKTKR